MDEKKQIETVHEKTMELIRITNELEEIYPGKSFKLDGILLGNIGEVLASYYYGISLYKQSEPTHDGEVLTDGKKVQIKITQSSNIILRECPDYILVLFLDRANGEVTEIYNGVGKRVWEASRYVKQMNHYSVSVPKLLQLRELIVDEERIKQEHPVKQYVRGSKKKT